MPLIHLTTFVAAPADRVFDLSRSIDLHKSSMRRHGEEAVGGRLTGLMEKGETVTWKARHLFRERQLEVRMTALERPHFFIDEQVRGDFARMKHEHYFKSIENGTLMIDQFGFEAPYGRMGSWVARFWLTPYLERLLADRNSFIKQAAESSQWKNFLNR